MDDPHHDFGTTSEWYGDTAGNLDDFIASLPDHTDPADWPHAAEIVDHVLIYDGDAVRAATGPDRRGLTSEWIRAFLNGPGVIVIRRAYADPAPIDRATALFERMIDDQRSTGAGAGDHFAKPGANDRIWNALEKHCLADPEGFALYYGNTCLALAAHAWLGPNYQFTAQVNRVNPGGAAQSPHRDYHLGFMSTEQAASYPAHIHRLSPALTLQGAVAHCDMPVESGPTMFLPYSQRYAPGYVAFPQPAISGLFRQTPCSAAAVQGRRGVLQPRPDARRGAATGRPASSAWRTCCRYRPPSAVRWRRWTAPPCPARSSRPCGH